MWVFSPFSPLMIYSVCLYFTMLVILWFTTGVKLQELMATHRHFNVMFFVFMAVSYFLIILAIPVINWPEANSIARYLSSWTRFQVSSVGSRRTTWDMTRGETSLHLLSFFDVLQSLDRLVGVMKHY
jgi:hypothetical protein